LITKLLVIVVLENDEMLVRFNDNDDDEGIMDEELHQIKLVEVYQEEGEGLHSYLDVLDVMQ
jgi:hypothetical protein